MQCTTNLNTLELPTGKDLDSDSLHACSNGKKQYWLLCLVAGTNLRIHTIWFPGDLTMQLGNSLLGQSERRLHDQMDTVTLEISFRPIALSDCAE